MFLLLIILTVILSGSSGKCEYEYEYEYEEDCLQSRAASFTGSGVRPSAETTMIDHWPATERRALLVRSIAGPVATCALLSLLLQVPASRPAGPQEPLRVTTESITTPLTNPPPTDLPAHLRRGFELAHLYCRACHLFPEPQSLTKEAWTNGALRMMALRVGAARLNYDRHPDGQILKEAGIFPDQPLLSKEDWDAICNYFTEMAPAEPLPQPAHSPVRQDLTRFRIREIKTSGGEPWTTLVKIDPARHQFYIGDAQARSLDLFDAAASRLASISVDSGPVSMVFKDDGAYLVLIGKIFPSDQLAGKLVFLQQTNGQYSVRTILDKLRRPADVAFADLNQDGRDDMIVSEFGHYLGQFSWFENLGANRFERHTLLERPGAIAARVFDFDKDGRPDFFVLMAQAWEGVYCFRNQANGRFDMTTLVEFPPVWGSSSFQLVDFNRDGFPDLLVTNGDSGDYVSPHKNYHGIRLYLNDGQNHFQERWFYPLHGAYHAWAADFDGDGDLDIAACSFFPDYLDPNEASFVYLENKGGLTFEAHTLPEHLRGRWLTMDVGDIDGDGDPDILLGSFVNGPASIPIPSQILDAWKTNHVAALLLENIQ